MSDDPADVVDVNVIMEAGVLGLSDETGSTNRQPDAAEVEGATPTSRKKTTIHHLSDAAWGLMSDDQADDIPAASSFYGIPEGAKTYFDFVTYLEEIDPEMARIETKILIHGVPAKDMAHDRNASTLSRRRQRVRDQFRDWREQSPFNKERALHRQIYRLWQEGCTNRIIEKRLQIDARHVRGVLNWMVPRYSHTMPRYQPGHAACHVNPFALQAQSRQDMTRRQRGPYRKGEQTKERVYKAIVELMTLGGEPPSKRKIQAEVGAQSNIDYPLGQLKAEGRIRVAESGQGYEPIPPQHRVSAKIGA